MDKFFDEVSVSSIDSIDVPPVGGGSGIAVAVASSDSIDVPPVGGGSGIAVAVASIDSIKKTRRKIRAISSYKIGTYMYVKSDSIFTWLDCMKSNLFNLLSSGIHRYTVSSLDKKGSSQFLRCTNEHGFIVIVKITNQKMTVTNTRATCVRLTSQEEADYEVQLQLYERLRILFRKLDSIRFSIENASNEDMNRRLVENLADFEKVLGKIKGEL